MTIQELSKIFPESKEIIKELIQNQHETIDDLISQRNKAKQDWKADPDPNRSWSYSWLIELIDQEIERAQTRIQILEWQLKAIKGKKKIVGGVSEDEIIAAKRVPIENLIINKRNHKSGDKVWAICPFHKNGQEKHPSFCVYTKTNSAYCFACGVSASDSIELIMKIHKLGFIEAVKYLLSHA